MNDNWSFSWVKICFSGVHISRVKSVNLDSWQPEQVLSLQQMGNSRARAVYEALLSDNFRRPQTDSGLESFIRAKYEQKKYIAREWIPPPPITKVDWDKEIEVELENQKRKKKTVSGTSTAIIPEPTKSAPSPVNVAIPAPLPKPHSPKNPRSEVKKTAVVSSSADLLGISLENSSSPLSLNTATNSVQKIGESFDFFSNVPSSSSVVSQLPPTNESINNNSLKQEEDDFFNQKTNENGSSEKGKMTKDSILALYGNGSKFTPPQAQQSQFAVNFQQYPRAQQEALFSYGQQPSTQPQQQAFGNFGSFNANFGTMQTQQINKLNEENLKKIESLNFNNFK